VASWQRRSPGGLIIADNVEKSQEILVPGSLNQRRFPALASGFYALGGGRSIMVSREEESQAYNAQVDYLTGIYRDGVKLNDLVKEIMKAFHSFHHPGHKAHFLFMLSKVLMDSGRKELAYKSFLETNRLFPETRFARAAADMSKTLFAQEGGSLRPVPSFALSVQIEPTNHCNLECIMCGRNKRRPLGHMDFETFSKTLDESLAAGAYAIRLYHMGEPLLNNSLIQFIHYFTETVRKLELGDPCVARSIGMMTNGTLLNSRLSEGLMESGLGAIGFSIDGRTPEEYEKIRRKASFSRVIENLRKTRTIRDDHRFPTKITVSVLDMELDQNDRLRLNDFYLQNGADAVSFLPCSPQKGRGVLNREGEIIPAGEAIRSDVPSSGFPEVGSQDYGAGNIDRIVVLWNGDIKSECGEPSEGDILGNIRELSLVEAYRIKMNRLGLS